MAGKATTGTVVIRKIKKGVHGHHGGAWKVAYADFVTAMMAFFLLLWLLNAATKEQLQGISDYFSPISTTASTSGGGGLLAGKTIAESGVFETATAPKAIAPKVSTLDSDIPGEDDTRDDHKAIDLTDEQAEELLRQREEQQFRQAEARLRQAIAESPDLKGLAKSLLVEETPEGLRIQILDQEGLPMFPRGEAEMFAHTLRVLELVARVVQRMPQDIAISGHTDATRFQGNTAYTNWELAADRANAARRALLQFGVSESRVSRVVGRAATDPLFPKDPQAPGNRRLSVVLLRGTGEGN